MKPNSEIKAEVLRERTNCAVAEYEVVLNRTTAANGGKHPTSKQIIAALDEWRSHFGARLRCSASPLSATAVSRAVY